MKRLTKKQWLRKKRRKRYFILFVNISILLFIICAVALVFNADFKNAAYSVINPTRIIKTVGNFEVTELLLTPNEYSRPQTPLRRVKGVVIHYTANPGTSAEANRNYFENLRIKKTTSASSHFVIGLDGEIIQCIPLNEISYASNDRNIDTISIECCHSDESGEFNTKTYNSLVALTAWISCYYNLDAEDILRHYDITGKLCPLYYVEHEDAWEQFKDDVTTYIDDNEVLE